MNGWILYKRDKDGGIASSYGVRRLVEAAPKHGIHIRVVAAEDFELIVTRDDRKSVFLEGQATTLPDFFIPRLGAETNYFALAVIRHLERLNVHSVNSSQSIENVKDKLYTQQLLAASGLPVPKTMLAKLPVDVELVERIFEFPLVIKTISGSKGTGVFLAENRSQFANIMDLANTMSSAPNLIFQEYIRDSHGRDLRVLVIGGRAVKCIQRRAQAEEFRANFSKGGTVEAFPMSKEIAWLATEATRVVGLDIAGVDLLFDGDHFRICEINSAPGYEGVEKSYELDVAGEIYNYVRTRLGIFH